MHNWRLLLFGVFVVFQASESFSDRGFVDVQRRSCDYRPPGTKINENLRYKSDSKTRGSQLTCQEQTTHQQARFMSRTADNDKLIDQRLEARRTIDNIRFINQRPEARRTVENGKFINPGYKARTVSFNQERIDCSDQTTTEDTRKKSNSVRGYSINERSLINRRITEERYLTANMKYNTGDGKIRSAIRDAEQVRSRDINAAITKKSRNAKERRALSRTEDNNERMLSGERRTVIRIVVRDARQVRSRDAESGIIRESRNVEERRSLSRAEENSEKKLSDERRSAIRMMVLNAKQVRSPDTGARLTKESRTIEERISLFKSEDNNERRLSSERLSAIRMMVSDAGHARSRDTDGGIIKESRNVEERRSLSRAENQNKRGLTGERRIPIRIVVRDTRQTRSQDTNADIKIKSRNIEQRRSLSRAEDKHESRLLGERHSPTRVMVRDAYKSSDKNSGITKDSCTIKERRSLSKAEDNNERRLSSERRFAIKMMARHARSRVIYAGITRESRNFEERTSLSRAEDNNEKRISVERRSIIRMVVRDSRQVRSLDKDAGINRELRNVEERMSLLRPEDINERRLSGEKRYTKIIMVGDARQLRSRDVYADITRESRNVEERKSLSRAKHNNEMRATGEKRSPIRMVRNARQVRSSDKDAGITRKSRNVEESRLLLRSEDINERTLSDKRLFSIRMVVRDARQVRSQGRDAGIKRDIRNDERRMSLSSTEDINEWRLSGEKRSTKRIMVGDARQVRSRDAYADITRESRNVEERKSLSRAKHNNEMRATGERRSPIRMVVRDARLAWSQDNDAGIIKESRYVEERRSLSRAENQNGRRLTGERRSAIRMMVREAGQVRTEEALISEERKTLSRDDRSIAMQMKDFTENFNRRSTRDTLIDLRHNVMRSRVLERRRDVRQIRDIENNNGNMNKKTNNNSNQRNFQSSTDDRTVELDHRVHDRRTQNIKEYQLEDISKISINLPATLYILQAIYVCSILMYMFGGRSEKKVSRAALWYTSKLVKVD